MAKRKKSGMSAAIFGPLGPEERRRLAAEDMARTAVDTDSGLVAKRAELTREILATTKRVMSGSRPFVRSRKSR